MGVIEKGGHLILSDFIFFILIFTFLRSGTPISVIKDTFILEKIKSRKYGVNLSDFCQFSAKEKTLILTLFGSK